MVVLPLTIQLVDFDPASSTNLGLSEIGDILTDTAVIGALGAGLTDLGGMSTTMKGQVETEANDALVGQNLDHLLKIAVDTDFATTVHNDSVMGEIADDGIGTGGGYDRTTDSLEIIAGNSGASAADIADAVWDETQSTHTTGGTFGELATEIALILVDTGTTLDDHLTDIKGTSFVKDTHSLIDIETYVDILDDGTSGNVKIAADVAATLFDTDTTLSGKIDVIDGIVDDILTDTGTTLDGKIDTIDSNVDIIRVDTETTLNDKIDVIDGIVDSILVDTQTTLNDKIDVIDGIVDDILVDTATTLENHLTDIKGTGFAKDTHSLIDIETYVDLIDDGTSGLAKIATDVADILLDTAVIGVLGAGLTDLGGMSSTMKGQVQAEADASLVSINLDHLLSIAVDTDFATTVHNDSVLGEIADDGIGTGGGFDRTTDSIEVIASSSAASAADIADAVWDETQSTHVTVGSFGEIATEIASILVDTETTIPGTITTIDGIVDDILVDTGTTLDAALAVVDSNVDDILVDTGTTLDAALAVVDGNVDSILVDTDTTIPGLIAALNDPSTANILAMVYEGSETFQDFLRLARSALAGKLSGAATTTIAIRDIADSKVRITATVDSAGNRTAVTTDAT